MKIRFFTPQTMKSSEASAEQWPIVLKQWKIQNAQFGLKICIRISFWMEITNIEVSSGKNEYWTSGGIRNWDYFSNLYPNRLKIDFKEITIDIDRIGIEDHVKHNKFRISDI